MNIKAFYKITENEINRRIGQNSNENILCIWKICIFFDLGNWVDFNRKIVVNRVNRENITFYVVEEDVQAYVFDDDRIVGMVFLDFEIIDKHIIDF